MSYSPERDYCKIKIKVELAKSDLKNASGVAKIVDLGSLKSVVDKADLDKLNTVPADLSMLSNVVKNCVAKNST